MMNAENTPQLPRRGRCISEPVDILRYDDLADVGHERRGVHKRLGRVSEGWPALIQGDDHLNRNGPQLIQFLDQRSLPAKLFLPNPRPLLATLLPVTS